MNFNFLNILAGLLLITTISFLLISLITFLFLKFELKEKAAIKALIKTVFLITVGWLLAVIISVMFASNSGNLIFGVVVFLLAFGTTFYLSGRLMKFDKRDKLLYSLLIAAIINPVWYFLLR